jgi:hypothetical protein
MKQFCSIVLLLVLPLLFFSGIALENKACNLTDLTLNSVSPGPGSNYTITMTACYGYGQTGSSKGADNDTRTVAIAWYSTDPLFSIISFGPPQMVGTYSGCTMEGSDLGPQGSPYNSQATILYIDPGYYMIPPCVDQPYGCVTSTALCGNVGQQCVLYTLELSSMPDSVRIFGAEGSGNPVAGCYPDADMMIDFSVLPARWGEFEAMPYGNTVNLNWTTVQELNTDFFIVERAAVDGDFIEIGTVQAAGTSAFSKSYAFVDRHPCAKDVQYRLLLVDRDGRSDHSEVVSVHLEDSHELSWVAVGPVPTRNQVNLTFSESEWEERLQFRVASIDGKLIAEREIDAHMGLNEIQLDLGEEQPGIYFVSLKNENRSLSYRILKQ